MSTNTDIQYGDRGQRSILAFVTATASGVVRVVRQRREIAEINLSHGLAKLRAGLRTDIATWAVAGGLIAERS